MPFFFAPTAPRRATRRPATNKPIYRAPPPIYAAPAYYSGRGRYRRSTDPAMVARRNQRTDNFVKVARALKQVLPGPSQLIKTFTGMGDYQVKTNSIMQDMGITSSGVVPVVSNTGSQRSVRIRHREFIQDVSSSTAFVNSAFQINPSNALCFPWLANIAKNFQEYRMHGLVFTFKSTSADALNSTNTALGTVIMSTDYNAGNSPFANKSQAENSEFTISCKPSENMLHGVECDPSITVQQGHLYISPNGNGTVPANQDIKTYNMGNFQLMTVGSQAVATIGELHVSYDIELIKPIQLQNTFDAPWFGSYDPSVNSSVPLGDAPDLYGTLDCSLDLTPGAQKIHFPDYSILGDRYLVSLQWQGSAAASGAIAFPTMTGTGMTAVGAQTPPLDEDAPPCLLLPNATLNGVTGTGNTATTATYAMYQGIFEITSASGPFYLSLGGSINLPNGNIANALLISCLSV